jgi:small conductance mechanosensitive channel
VDKSLQDFLLSLIAIALKILLMLTVMSMIGIEITSFIALIGAAGLAVGMALQGTLQNFAGGIIILLLKPFKVGDFIEQGSFSGIVRKIQIFNTVLTTGDNKTIILPNTQLATSPLINYTKSQIRRVDVTCGIAYGESVDKARQAMLDLAAQRSDVLAEPDKPVVHLIALSDSSVDMQLRVWVKTEDYWNACFSLNQAIYDKFNELNIEIPFKQLQIHVKKENL